MIRVVLALLIFSLTLGLPSAQQFLSLEPGQIQYITIISNILHQPTSLFDDLPVETQEYLSHRYSLVPNSSNWTSRDYDQYLIDQTFSHLENWNKTLQILINQSSNFTKQSILSLLEQRFNDSNYSATLLYYSGPTEKRFGGWSVSTEDKWKGILSYNEVAKKWKDRSNKQELQHLHIIIEGDYSEHWAERCYNQLDFDDISVQASALKNQTASSIKFGGLFTHNLNKMLSSRGQQAMSVERVGDQHLTGVGFELYLQRLYGMEIYHASWEDLLRSRRIPSS